MENFISYSLILKIISILIFLTPFSFFIGFILRHERNKSRLINGVKGKLKKNEKEKFDSWLIESQKFFNIGRRNKTILVFIGCIGISGSLYILGKLIEWIFIQKVNILFSFAIMPLISCIFCYFFFIYFIEIVFKYNKGKDIDSPIRAYLFLLFPRIEHGGTLEIRGGTLNPYIYKNEWIIKGLRYLKKKKNTRIRILAHYPKNINSKKANQIKEVINKFEENNLINNLFLLPYRPDNQFEIAGTCVRIIKKHTSWLNRTTNYVSMENCVYLWNPLYSMRLSRIFNEELIKAEPANKVIN